MQMSAMGVAAIAAGVGVPTNQLATCVAIAWAESGLRTEALGHNGPTDGCPLGSNDRGLWQINDCYHSEVSNACAFDANCNARAMYRISKGGVDWQWWSTYKNGWYKQYLAASRIAVANLGIGQTIPPGTPQTFHPLDYANALINQGQNPFEVIKNTISATIEWVANQT